MKNGNDPLSKKEVQTNKKIEQKIFRFIKGKKLINENDRILVGFSGGPDSIFLLYFLNKFKEKFRIKLGAVHINHKLRGADARKDEEFCREFCKNLKIPFFSVQRNVKAYSIKKKISFEEAGRDIRYEVFRKTASRNNFNKTATAHNSNDNAETILLNLVKGSGILGISGIPIKREEIIRPILVLSKEEILHYLKQNNIEFRIDKTNLNINYERNFLRSEIIPILKEKLNPSLEDTLFKSSEVFKKISLVIKRRIESFFDSIDFSKKENLMKISLKILKLLEEEYLGDFLKEAVKRNFSVKLTFNDIDKLVLLLNSKTGKKVNLSENLSALREREEILIFFDVNDEKFEPLKVHVDDTIKLNGKTFTIRQISKGSVKLSNNRDMEFISVDKCREEFILREWKNGDRFYPIGLNTRDGKQGSKKVSDFLNEKKISSFLKKKQLVLTSQNKIVWILGLRLDDRFKLTNETKRIYQLCLMQE